MTARVIGSGKWDVNKEGIRMTTMIHSTNEAVEVTSDERRAWTVGQIVDVRPRTWAGINRPGGTGRITKIHYSSIGCKESIPAVIGLDVKYCIYSGHDLHLDPDLVTPHTALASRERRRSSTIKPTSSQENCPSHSHNCSTKGAKRVPKKGVIGAKKGSASKKTSLSRRIGFPGRRKSVTTVLQSSESPSCVSNEALPSSSCIPREIVITAPTATTPNSECSKSGVGVDTLSPLGDEGVETHQTSTASYRAMMKSQNLPADAPNTSVENKNSSKSSTMDAMDCEIFHLQLSPRSRCDVPMKESLISATPLATGRFSTKRQFSFEETNKVNATFNTEECVESPANINVTSKSKDGPQGKPSLWAVYDHEMKKATQFIGDVVQGYTNNRIDREICKKATVEEKRLNEFRNLLNDLLFDSDGMIEVANLPADLKKVAATASKPFEFTDHEVDLYLDELCVQNKIMRTEGWIYNI